MSTTDFSRYDPEIPLYCANHPDTETFLRCGKCEKPICARCRVSTPVGFRCFDCAKLSVLPTYAVTTDIYIRAAVAGLVAAAILGVLMGIFRGFEFWAALIMGIIVPEAIAAASNQKRGPGLRIVSMASIAFGFIISRVVMQAFPTFLLLGGVNTFSSGGVSWLDNLPIYLTQYSLLWLVMAMVLAYQRLK